ncbi:hypothetical protein V1512DRAFT_266006 [Lipomyces arxii]|uniref:uncharacterized protein n=1 Tax=Lipomyces arxii TaxID=56418 RepID=UPI0034CEF49C
MLYSLFSLVFIASNVLANIEQVRFFAPFSTSEELLSFTSAKALPLALSKNPASVRTVYPKFPDAQSEGGYAVEEYFLLTDLRKGSLYEFRACWPANFPLDVKVGTVKASDLDQSSELYHSKGSGDALYAYLKYSSSYFSHIELLMNHPRPVPMEVIFSKCTIFVVLGDSIAMQLMLVIVGVLTWKYGSTAYYKFLKSLIGHDKRE